MNIPFYKYQGTGNDFVMIDNRSMWFPIEDRKSLIHFLCDRRFGIGGDGLILLEEDGVFDFKMVYFNADGAESTMCGNGGRCIVAFAQSLGIFSTIRTKFRAIDGVHEAKIKNNNWVELKMNNVNQIHEYGNDWILNTGSPHYVQFVTTVQGLDVYNAGRAIRYNADFETKGINVNFVEILEDKHLSIVTYERGVENETLSCGTGVTACALVYGKLYPATKQVQIKSKGGRLEVRFTRNEDDTFEHIWLCGSANLVFSGNIHVTRS